MSTNLMVSDFNVGREWVFADHKIHEVFEGLGDDSKLFWKLIHLLCPESRVRDELVLGNDLKCYSYLLRLINRDPNKASYPAH